MIENRAYPLVVKKKDEARYREAAKELSKVVDTFKANYPGKDMQDILAMTAFQFVYGNMALKENIEHESLNNEIKNLIDDIDDFLE